ncbi:hypothetical protein LINGRAHAP2_LOCUS13408 [Linum grandiflorum]
MAHKALKVEKEEEEAGVELKPSWFPIPFHQPTNCQMIFYNQHPFSQLCWPSIIQSSNAVQAQQETHENAMSGRATSLCLMSCPWFLPLAESANGQNTVSVDDQCCGSSSSQSLKLKPEAAASSPEVGMITDLNEIPMGERGDDAYHHNKATQPDACGYPEKVCGDPFSFTNKKPVDAAAATMARRRRKELTRLKHLHGARQCRMNC